MDMDITFKRLGHLGEVHMVETGSGETLCGIRSDGPNFSIVAPVALEPRPSPQLCTDCKDQYDKLTADEEEAEAEAAN